VHRRPIILKRNFIVLKALRFAANLHILSVPASIILLSVTSSFAQAQDAVHDFDIPAQPLGQVLDDALGHHQDGTDTRSSQECAFAHSDRSIICPFNFVEMAVDLHRVERLTAALQAPVVSGLFDLGAARAPPLDA
jgi:hypothetical protein